MRRRGVILAGGAAIVVALVGGVAAAQSEPCDARPRWLAVTVVGGLVAAGAVEPFEVGVGVKLLDRCGPSPIGSVSELSGDEVAAGSQEAHAAGGRTMMTAGQLPNAYFIYYVRETVQEICAVLDDCADATAGKIE